MKARRRIGVFCYRCVHPLVLSYRCYTSAFPYVLDERQRCAGPPVNIHANVADVRLGCTRCGDDIPIGRGYLEIRARDGDGKLVRCPPDVAKRETPPPLAGGAVFDTLRTALGLWLAVSPLALWIAPTVPVFVAILVAIVSAAAALWLIERVRGLHETGKVSHRAAPPRRLPDRFIAHLHALMPAVHHNRLPGAPGFQRKMDALKRTMEE